jgi:hypothetical protein
MSALYVKLLVTDSALCEYTLDASRVPRLTSRHTTLDQFIEKMFALRFQGTEDDARSVFFDSRPIVNADFILYVVETLSQEKRTPKDILNALKTIPKIDLVLDTFRKSALDRSEIRAGKLDAIYELLSCLEIK